MGGSEHNSALARADAAIATHAARHLQPRPLYHFTPPFGWMNDPNGLIQWRGQYHLFYQHNPFGTKWANMHWGHAVSDDLLHWRDLPEALAPSEAYDNECCGGCYSGSAVAQDQHLSLLYTGCIRDGAVEKQTQNLAFSDDGVHFTKYAHNPVIAAPPAGASEHFRDPKVWRQDGVWHAVVGGSMAGLGCVFLYTSSDLVNWHEHGILHHAEADEGWMWECPDFFLLDGRWMLTVSAMESGKGDSLWFVGDFDSQTKRFTVTQKGLTDFGTDFYAPQSFIDDRGRRILLAWAGSRSLKPGVEQDAFTAAAGYCGHMTLPRRVTLAPDGHPCFFPIAELNTLRQAYNCGEATLTDRAVVLLQSPVKASLEMSLLLCFAGTVPDSVTLTLRHDREHLTSLTYTPSDGLLRLDRAQTDSITRGVISVPVGLVASLPLRLWLDRSSLEVFIGDGRQVVSANLFPTYGKVTLELCVSGAGRVTASWEIWQLAP